MNDFEAALLGGNMTAVGRYFDVPAAVDYMLGTELTKNPDGYRCGGGGTDVVGRGGSVGGFKVRRIAVHRALRNLTPPPPARAAPCPQGQH